MSLQEALPEYANKFFEPVDWSTDPIALIDGSFGKSEEPIRLSDCSMDLIKKRFNDAASSVYTTYRRLSGGSNTYESCLNIAEGGFAKIIKAYRKQFGGRAVAVLDSGCGDGNGLAGMADLPGINPDECTGITVHDIAVVPKKVKDKILQINIADIRPKKIPDGLKRFDFLTSVYGTIGHHPLNRMQAADFTFGLLHGINFVKDGGLIFSNTLSHLDFWPLSQLIQLGILEQAEDFAEYGIKNSLAKPRIIRVKRRPTLNEIKSLLNIGDDNVYDITTTTNRANLL